MNVVILVLYIFCQTEDEVTRRQVLVRIKNILFLEEKLKVSETIE